MFRLNSNHIRIAPEAKILKAKDYTSFLKASEIIKKAEEKAAQIEEDAQKAYEELKQQGYEEGLLEGRMEYGEKMLDTAMAAIDYLENLEEALVRTVIQAVRKVVGEIDSKELIVKVIRVALTNMHSQQKVLLKISAADEEAVREALDVMLKTAPGSLNYIDIMVDPRMTSGNCVLESELGLLDASVETQLTILENALLKKVKSN